MLWNSLARCPLGDVDKTDTVFNTAKQKEYKPSELLSDVSNSKKKKRGRKAPAPPSAATVTYVQ